MTATKSPTAVAAGKLAHKERDENGKSVLALKNNAAIHREKDERGKSLVASAAGRASMAELDEKGRSINGQRAAKAAIQPKVEKRRAASRRRKMLSRTEDEMLAHVEGMTLRGAEAQLGIYYETWRMKRAGVIDDNGELL